MKYAVIQLGGRQFKIKEGDVFQIERQAKLNIDVLMYSDDKKTLIGEPFLKDVTVTAGVVEEIRGDKVRVARFRSKSRYSKVKGHRQPLSVVEISAISLKGAKSEAKADSAGEKAAGAKKPAKKTAVKSATKTKAESKTTKAKTTTKKSSKATSKTTKKTQGKVKGTK